MAEALIELLSHPDAFDKFRLSLRGSNDADRREGSGAGAFPVDILDSPKEYVLYVDVPGLFKLDIQVTLEEENTLVIKSNGKRKREEECKYTRLERRLPQKLARKFKLPENCNMSAISAKCQNGVLTVVVEKLPPPPAPKKVEVTIS